MSKSTVESLFPFDSFRENQRETIEAIIKALYDEGYSNVVLDAPVGSGKSAVITTVLRYGGDGFYVTPQRSLREQLQADEALDPHLDSLKARKDYHCKVSGENCEECPVYTSSEDSCAEQGPLCSYWSRKMSVINSDIANVTFAYLIIDSNLPVENNGQPISFGNRSKLAVDEAHNLAQQVEEMHAGFKLSPFLLPTPVFNNATNTASYDANMYEDVKTEVNTILQRCLDYIGDTVPMEMSPEQKSCHQIAEKIKWMHEEIANGNPWVADVDSVPYAGGYEKVIQLRPINVSSFLRNFVWDRAEKRIISTATLPYRGNPEIWLRKVGLDPNDTKVINVSMTFPVENRPIHTSSMVASMSGGGFEDNLDDVLEEMNKIAERHYNEKGLVHTASYPRAQLIADNTNEKDYPYLHNNLYVHNQDRDPDVQIEEWQESDYDMMLSPSMAEGVDLKDDKCRFQMLAKVPYPPRDSRLEYVLNNEDWGWMEMYERTLIRIVQSYGRAVRSKTDHADYYVLDEDLNKILKKRQAPDWFLEAIDIAEPSSKRSLFDL